MAKTKRRRRLRVKPEPDVAVVPVEDLADELLDIPEGLIPEEIDEEPIRKARRILKKGEPVDDEGPEEEIIEPEPLPEYGKVVFSTDPMTDVLNDLEEGHAVVITREDGERYSMRVLETNEFSATPVMSHTEYIGIVYSEEYKEFEKEWGGMDSIERMAYAKNNKVKWQEHDVHRINMLRVTQAVREFRNISKYKPEWDTKAKRSKIRPKK